MTDRVGIGEHAAGGTRALQGRMETKVGRGASCSVPRPLRWSRTSFGARLRPTSRPRPGSTALSSSPRRGWCSGYSRSRCAMFCPVLRGARRRSGILPWCSSRRRCWRAMPSRIFSSATSRPPGRSPLLGRSLDRLSPSRHQQASFASWETCPAISRPSSGCSGRWRARSGSPSWPPRPSPRWFRAWLARAGSGAASVDPYFLYCGLERGLRRGPCLPTRSCSSPFWGWIVRPGFGAPFSSALRPSSSFSGWQSARGSIPAAVPDACIRPLRPDQTAGGAHPRVVGRSQRAPPRGHTVSDDGRGVGAAPLDRAARALSRHLRARLCAAPAGAASLFLRAWCRWPSSSSRSSIPSAVRSSHSALVHLLVFALAALCCHGALARLRPPAADLTASTSWSRPAG